MQSIRQFRSGIEQLCFYAREEVMGLFVMVLGIASICAVVLVVLLILLFFGVTDGQGDRGIIRIVAGRLDTEGTDYAAYTDYEIYETESTKTALEIIYQDMGYLPVGTVNFLDNVTVTDYAGKIRVPIKPFFKIYIRIGNHLKNTGYSRVLPLLLYPVW